MLHLPPLYKRFHKYHHAIKEPEPFNDMYIHPLEAFCYYCILYAPPFLFPCHVFAFIGYAFEYFFLCFFLSLSHTLLPRFLSPFRYMIVMGLAGTLDHSGIRVHVPGVSTTLSKPPQHTVNTSYQQNLSTHSQYILSTQTLATLLAVIIQSVSLGMHTHILQLFPALHCLYSVPHHII